MSFLFKKLQGNHVNLLALAVVSGIFLVAHQLHIGFSNPQAWGWLLSTAMATSLFAALFNYWRLLKITEAPISTIAAAAQGYIELHGTAFTSKPLHTPYHGISCVWYRAFVYVNQANRWQKKPEDYRLIEYAESKDVFQLKDATGECSVNPKGAEIIYAQQRTSYKNNHRYIEEFLPAGKALYVLGQLDTRDEFADQKAIQQEVSTILTDLKKRPQYMLNRYDQNRNGQIDMDEWQLARQDAMQQAQAKLSMKAHTGDFMLAKPNDHHLFLISAKSPDALSTSYRHWAIAHFSVLIALLLALIKLT
ncbi:MAG: hypothetical protein HOP21_05305 [Methylotenera sp.]|nr:hypothetical protein [Methylotenera sp.]